MSYSKVPLTEDFSYMSQHEYPPSTEDGKIPTEPVHPEVPQEQVDVKPPARGEAAPKFGDLGNFWKHVDKMTDHNHTELVEGLKKYLDNLLIFAALFSAVNSTFMGFSIPNLNPGNADQTNQILLMMYNATVNQTFAAQQVPIVPEQFNPKTDAIRVNQLFSISLSFSLLAALGSLLGQQWIIHYNKSSPAGSEKERWERQRKLDAAKRWYLEPIVEIVLPGLLQLALFIFMIGFVDFLYGLHPLVALPNAILFGLGFLIIIITMLASIRDPYCPYRTSLPRVLGRVLRGLVAGFFDMFDRLPTWITRYINRVENHVQEGLDREYLERFRRDPQPIQLLMTLSACHLLEKSEEPKVLLDTAKNIPILRDPEQLSIIYKNKFAMHRLRELATEEIDTTIYSEAVCHLLLTVKEQEAAMPTYTEKSELLVLFERATEGHIRDQNDPISYLPTSVAAVTFTVAQSLALGTQTYSLRPHKDFFIRSLSYSNPIITIGLVAWALLAGREFIPNKAERLLVMQSIGIIHPLRKDRVDQEMDDVGIALRTFENIPRLPTAEHLSKFLHFVFVALENSRQQSRSTHKFVNVVTTGLLLLFSNSQLSWITQWEVLLLLMRSLNPLLASSGSMARPIADEQETDGDWIAASQDAVKLVDHVCYIVKTKYTDANRFATEATAKDSTKILCTFTQYIKHLARQLRNGRPAEELPFEELARSVENIDPNKRKGVDPSTFAEFQTAWADFQALPQVKIVEPVMPEIPMPMPTPTRPTTTRDRRAFATSGVETVVDDPYIGLHPPSPSQSSTHRSDASSSVRR